MKGRVRFERDYATFSLTQQYQNSTLLSIIGKELGKYVPRKILDVGCGDGKLTIALALHYPQAQVVGIDLSEDLLEVAQKRKESRRLKNIRFLYTDYFDFREAGFDVVVSNNVFHWFGERAREGYEKLMYHLVWGGYFFVHQGGRWSYVALRYLMERMLRERGIEPPPYPLFYPTKKRLEEMLREMGYTHFNVLKRIEHEIENRQVYVDFTYAGGLPYIEALPEEERESFRVEFVRRCVEEECPALPVRLYVWGRSTPPLSIEVLKGESLELYRDEVREVLEEVDREFVPPLSSRSSTTDQSFEGKEGSVRSYLDSLMKQTFILALDHAGKVAGFLSFIEDYEFEGRKWNYVSTIAVRKVARNLGVSQRLYRELLGYSKLPVLTRTWEGNDAHVHVLKKLGFLEVKRLENHRGEGIDTIYFGTW